jgi:DNA-binding CsgD family transcriptional regulator
MEQLRDRDLRGILAFLRDAYAQPDLDAYAHWVVDRVTRVVGAERVSYNEANARRGTLRMLIRGVDGIPPLTARQLGEHPMMRRFVTTGDGRAHKFSDFLTREQLHRTEMYQEHYRPAGVEYQMTICLGSPAPHTIAFALGRDLRDFSERDRLALNLLHPHLATAYDRSSAAARLRARMTLFGRAAEVAGAGMILLSGSGRIEFITHRARHWLREYFPRRGRPSSRLPIVVDDWLRRQEAWDPDTRPSEPEQFPPPPAPLTVRQGDRRLVIRAIGEPAERALLLEESCAGFQPAALAPLGLTPRENEVLALVARGVSNEAIGRAIGAQPRTVAKHVERINRKLGVDSRTAAAARAHEVVTASTRLSE